MNGFQALLAFLVIVAFVDSDLLEKYGRRSDGVYHGRYTRDIHEPEFLIPRRVFEDGSFDTYTLPNFYDRQEIGERRKRSIEAGEQGWDTAKLHLVLPFNGIEHHVELSPYHEFISPDMVVETRAAGLRSNLGEALRFQRASDRQCHYRGFVRGHQPSRAALSLCDGVVGYVQTNHGRYFIEPAHETEPQADGQHVHIAYRRDDPRHENKGKEDSSAKHCATSDNWQAAWAEQLAKRQKRLMEENPEEAKRAASVSYATHSIHRYIEIGLVADRRFLDFHKKTNYEQYLLTIMNMVSDFYHDKSVGNQIDVVVVRMIFLEKEKEEIDLLISPAAEDTLASFAKWAHKMNPKDHTHPNHYDIAALVTRYDICSEGTNCDLMGLAYVGTACDPAKAACINEDSGLLLGIVIAHEVGHVMGCSHDEVSISGCPPQDKDESYFVMSPIVFIYTIRWSTCSRKFITTLLETGLGECLNDDPRNPPEKFKYPNMLPGAMYDADFQCEMQFAGSKLCPNSPQGCDKLWCLTNSSCLSRGMPMADGTKCGENKWCIQKKCVDMGSRPAAVHGGWGRWGSMSTCSRSCGGGLQAAERECDNPPPANGGRYCTGERKKMSICNVTPCDPKNPSYRAVQCSSYDKQNILSDGLHQWSPYYAPDIDPCALFCINEKRAFVQIEPTVNDSTPCKPGTNDMCIASTCRKVGCDWVLDSSAVEDKCGICKGDGTKCKAIEGSFDTTNAKDRFVKVVTIPRGARSIHVSELKRHKNMLAVRLEKTNAYCLNGNMSEQRSGDYECAKALLVYLHPEPDREEIAIKGPIMEDIRIEYVFYRPDSNPGIRYTYYVTSTDPSYTPKYIWDFMEWSECSAKCGGGTMIYDTGPHTNDFNVTPTVIPISDEARCANSSYGHSLYSVLCDSPSSNRCISEPTCIEENGGKVSSSFCDGIARPEPKSRVCNADACPAKWRVSQWSKCSACDGKKGTRHRKVQCIRPAARAGGDDVQANLDACRGRVPKQTEDCVGQRPCKKLCPKKTRKTNARPLLDKQEKQPLSPQDRTKMIDKFVDLSLARYLEKSYGGPREDDDIGKAVVDSPDFRQLLREWSIMEEEKRKRGVCERNVSTPKTGSIIKDSIPVENVVLMQAPFMDEGLRANLSDRGYQETGDVVGVGIDTSQLKIYNGTQAVEMIEKLERHRETTRRSSRETGNAYDELSKIVDAAD